MSRCFACQNPDGPDVHTCRPSPAEALIRERNGNDSCWQCEQFLGTGPDRCLTCTTKRAEDRARDSASKVGQT